MEIASRAPCACREAHVVWKAVSKRGCFSLITHGRIGVARTIRGYRADSGAQRVC